LPISKGRLYPSLRPRSASLARLGVLILVGPAYVYGIVQGQAFNEFSVMSLETGWDRIHGRTFGGPAPDADTLQLLAFFDIDQY
jgi:hypothetical protein